jgi:hypothetical protein
VRFLLDYLRFDDVRYWHFTPGQYSAAALLVVGVLILGLGRRVSMDASQV